MRLQALPLRVRDCADWMGLTPEWIRKAITEGVSVHGHVVKLVAEVLPLKRRMYRIHEDKFTEFLIAIEWTRLPRATDAGSQERPRESTLRSVPHVVNR